MLSLSSYVSAVLAGQYVPLVSGRGSFVSYVDRRVHWYVGRYFYFFRFQVGVWGFFCCVSFRVKSYVFQ